MHHNRIKVIIPQPNRAMYGNETVKLTSQWKIITTQNVVNVARYLKKEIKTIINWEIELHDSYTDIPKNPKNFTIVLHKKGKAFSSVKKKLFLEEGYSLTINKKFIYIEALTLHGLFNAIQSFLQILTFHMGKEIIPCIFDYTADKVQERNISEIFLPNCEITDFPRFQYRGFMLDVGRHFHPVEQIKEILDIMAFFKLNRFHWHLTEDQGWRIEIKKWPKLTEIGSKRKDTQIGGFKSLKMRGKPHEGFYSQEEIQEIIEYASERFIQIIPEIDIPGHSRAAIAAYPHLSCSKKATTVPTKAGIFKTIYCAGQEATYQFLEDIFTEIADLFPFSYVHIGGDEAPKKNWKECQDCQKIMQIQNLNDEQALQVYFTNRIAEFLQSKKKKIMGWNEIVDPNLFDNAIIQFWMRGKEQVKLAMEQGHQVVNSHFFHYYLDYKYCLHPLKKVYEYEPMFSDISKKAQENLIGIEAPLWTEWIPTRERLHWQAFPRLFAIAESAWTFPANKDYINFKAKLNTNYPKLKKLGFALPKFSTIDPSRIKRFFQMFRVRKMPLV